MGGVPRVLVAAGPGRTWEWGPEPGTLGSALVAAAAGAGASRVWTRKPAEALAPALLRGLKKNGGKKLPAPGCVMQGTLWGGGGGGRLSPRSKVLEANMTPEPGRAGPCRGVCAPLLATTPCAAQGPSSAGGPPGSTGELVPRAAVCPAGWGGARLCARGSSRMGSAPRVLSPS